MSGGGIIDATIPMPRPASSSPAVTRHRPRRRRAKSATNEWTRPWTYAITKIVAQRVKRCVPTYTALFEEAKALIKRPVDCGCELNLNKYFQTIAPLCPCQLLKTTH